LSIALNDLQGEHGLLAYIEHLMCTKGHCGECVCDICCFEKNVFMVVCICMYRKPAKQRKLVENHHMYAVFLPLHLQLSAVLRVQGKMSCRAKMEGTR